MLVKDLVISLSKLDQEQLILVDGYEQGYSNIDSIYLEDIYLVDKPEPWEGTYDWDDKKSGLKAYILSRSPI
jgi:hypothetical protein